jgi:hypothetical protein
MMPTLTAAEFAAKWRRVTTTEKAVAKARGGEGLR